MSGTFEQKKGVGPICHLDKKWETIQNIVTYRKTTNSSHYAHHLHDHWPPCEHPSRKNMASTLFHLLWPLGQYSPRPPQGSSGHFRLINQLTQVSACVVWFPNPLLPSQMGSLSSVRDTCVFTTGPIKKDFLTFKISKDLSESSVKH